MRQPESIFFESSLGKVVALVDMWNKEQEAINNSINGTAEPNKIVHKFSDIGGFI